MTTCCICGEEIEAVGTWTSGNNALPVKDGRCCYACNASFVIPARLEAFLLRETSK